MLDNIEDESTDPTKKRKIKIELEFEPSVSRDRFALDATVSSTLAPKSAMSMNMNLKSSEDGNIIITEQKEEAEGQMDIYGNEEPEAAQLMFNPKLIGNYDDQLEA